MLQQIVESFFQKVGEKLVDYAHSKVTDITNLKFDVTNLKEALNLLCATAMDVEDKIETDASGKKKRKREVEDWLRQVQLIQSDFLQLQSGGHITRLLSGGRVAKLNKQVNELVEQSRHFGEVLVNDYDRRGQAFLAAEMFGEAFEENLDTIWGLLVDDKVGSIGIYGMGGIGKTTLMKHIHNLLLQETQDCVFWVTVSQVFSVNKLQDELARAMGLKLSDKDDTDRRAAELSKAFSTRESIVLILDDVWENIKLEKVGYPLGREGCRLVITTRSLKVCHQFGCKKINEVKTLHNDEAWDLFKETLGHESVPSDVEEIAKCMVKMCDGLPLGIITLAGSMRGEMAIHVWRNALTELKKSFMGHDDMEDQVYKVLKYSFDRLLPNHQQGKRRGYTNLQLCFLYCALYPEDCKIPRNELVRKFISEDLVDTRKSMKAQYDEGHSMLDKLVNTCLLESTHNHKDGDSVRMHDLMRAMALKITEGKTVVIAGHSSLKEIPNEEEWREDLENLSLIQSGIEVVPFEMSPKCPKLLRLLLRENPFNYLPGSFFSRMHALCTLDLSRTRIKDLPDSLSDLKSLKALLLGECRELAAVPNLGKLKSLRELDLSYSGIRKVPQGTEKLLNLQRLLLNGANYIRMLPTGLLANLSNLQLLLLPYQVQTPVEDIERLKRLEEFAGPVEDARDFSRVFRSRSRAHGTYYSIQVRLVYDGFSRRRNQVTFYLCDLEKGDENHDTMSAQDILVFHHCDGLSNCLADDISRLDDPRSLKLLEVYNSRGIECMFTYAKSVSQFSSLEKILLQELPDFMGMIHRREAGPSEVFASPTFAPAAFSSLKYLTICKCNKMNKLGLPASEFPKLERICVRNCDEIQEIIETADGTGRGEAVGPFVSLPRLRQLYLIQLPRLSSICKAKMLCDSINIIHVEQCQALKKLPLNFPESENHTLHEGSYHGSPPPSLEEIWILEEEREWWDSLEWEHPIQSHLIQPFLRFWD
ncbi:probable disease resistance protein At4g27220 [Salvia miltiorrhiza]|uniref:probable disease resistance protein At4g27220 n=1 Tax=Salvia miltiorrhiza TaxID=226208 RepID=UPI0025ACF6A2|nr:probable disease resistance protein At4g27220 [Salvia miltiorrhiza]